MNSHDVEGEATADREAYFNQVYEAHRPSLHAFLWGRSGDPEMALDLLQETFLRAWRHRPTLQGMPPARHRYWLFTVARNLLTDHYRRQASRSEAERELQLAPAQDRVSPLSPDVQLAQQEELRQLDIAIQHLPEESIPLPPAWWQDFRERLNAILRASAGPRVPAQILCLYRGTERGYGVQTLDITGYQTYLRLT